MENTHQDDQSESIYTRRIREVETTIKQAQEVLQRAADVRQARPASKTPPPPEAIAESERLFKEDMREVEEEVAAKLMHQKHTTESADQATAKPRKIRNLV